MPPQGCYVYDSYLNRCIEWREAAWWEYVNAASAAAVVAAITVGICVVLFVYAGLHHHETDCD